MMQIEIDYKRLKQDLNSYNVEKIVFNSHLFEYIKKNDPMRIKDGCFIFNSKKYNYDIIKTPVPYSVVWGNV